jgi:two-component system, NarL family, sensor kinase
MEDSISTINLSLTASAIAGVLALAIIVFALVFNKRKAAHKLELSNLEVSKQMDLLNAQVQSSDDERNRIASLLHDDVNNQLTIFKMQLRQVSEKESRAALNTEIDQIIDQLRDLSHELSTQQVTRFGLSSTLSSIKSKLAETNNTQLELYNLENSKTLSPEKAVHLFRVFQELIGNSIKHGKASRIDISFEQTDNQFVVMYQDNGLGFQPEEKSSTGLGMKNIQSRVQQLQGESEIDSHPGKGVNFKLTLDIL